MLGFYLNIAVKNLIRNRAFTTINVLGLALGLSCCMLLIFYIQHQLSYDKHQEHAEELYLVGADIRIGDGEERAASHISAPYAFTLKAEFPEIEEVSRLFVNMLDVKALLQVREEGKAVQTFYQDKGYQVDSTFFQLFTYQFKEGNPRYALTQPRAVVLSEEVAGKLFGDGPALNKTIRISGTTGNSENFIVTGVYKENASNPSHIDAKFFVPISAGWIGDFLSEGQLDFLNNNMFYTYVRLRPGTDPRQLEQKFPAFMQKYASADMKDKGEKRSLFLVNVKDLHLYERFEAVVTPTSSMTYIYILASIALFTLLIACVNFMNLSTAMSIKRAAEVGIRKVLGAERIGLMRQFLIESVVLALVALVFSFLLVSLLLPLLNQVSSNDFSFTELLSPFVVLVFIGLAVFTGLLAGLYPALFLSGYKPVQVLKGKFANSLSAVSLRRALVVFQFVIAIGLMLATFIIDEQIRYIRNKPLGFAQDQQIVIPLRSEKAKAAYKVYRNEVERHQHVVAASGADFYPGIVNAPDWVLHTAEMGKEQAKTVWNTAVDYNYLQTMGFRLKKGRLFSSQFPADTINSVVVNEAALASFNIPVEEAIGKALRMGWLDQTFDLQIVGVVENFHFKSLHQPIEPYLFYVKSQPSFNYLVASVNMLQVDDVLAHLEQKWKEVNPDEPFEFSFMNADFQKNYQAEQQTAMIVRAFTGTAILISCMGLFGLAAFSTQLRTKEIGVRKVLGASVASIVALLSKDFLKLVFISIIIASPLAWYAMSRWLEDFAYRITVPWWVFVLTSMLAIAIAFVTVSFQSIKAALMNPVNSLRTE